MRPSFNYGSSIDHDATRGHALDYRGLKELIQKNQIGSLNELFEFLSSHRDHQAFLSNFTLLYNSESSQRFLVTPEYPRIILHKDRLILGTVANSERPDLSENLEVIDYDTKSATFNFHRINFYPKTDSFHFEDEPTSCKNCHRGRPLWATYNRWPGAYGSDHDRLAINPNPFLKDPPFGELFFREGSLFLKFLARHRQMPTYKFLRLDEERYLFESRSYNLGLLDSPNFSLNRHLAVLNFHRIVQQISGHKDFGPYKFAIFGAILDCSDIESFLSPLAKKKHETILKKSFAEILLESREINLKRFNERLARFNKLRGSRFLYEGSFDDEVIQITSKLRYIVEGLGMDTHNWSMSVSPRAGEISYEFEDGGLGIKSLRSAIRLKEKYSCENLRKKSISSLNEVFGG